MNENINSAIDPEPLLVYVEPLERIRWLTQLRDGSPDERLQAVEDLGPFAAVDDEVRDALRKQHALDDNTLVRERIAALLASPGGRRSAPPAARPADEEMMQLVGRLREGSQRERIQVVNRLTPFASTDADVRRLLWEQLATETDPAAGEALLRVLGPLAGDDAELRGYLMEFKPPDYPALRAAVVEELSPLAETDSGVRRNLLERLQDEEDPQARARIVGALGDLAVSDVSVRQALLARLQNDRAPLVRVAAVEALAPLAESDAGVRQALQERLQDKEEVVFKAARDALNQPERSRLLAQLDSQDWQERRRAVIALAPQAVGSEKVRFALRRMTADGRYQVRAAAVKALGRLADDQQVLDALVACLGDRSVEVFAAAADVLGERRADPRVRQALLARVADDDPAVRFFAVKSLAGLAQADEAVRQALLECLDDADGSVRETAAFALAFLAGEDDRVRQALLRSLVEGDDQARLAALVALSRLASSHRNVRQAFLDRVLVEKNYRVRRGLVEALGYLGEDDAEARRAVEAALEDKNAYVRYSARRMLRGSQPGSSTLSALDRGRLLSQLDDGNWKAQQQAVQLLGPHARTVPVVRQALLSRLDSERHAAVREDLIAALAPLAQSDREVAQALGLQLKDPNPDVREAAREALAGKSAESATAEGAGQVEVSEPAPQVEGETAPTSEISLQIRLLDNPDYLLRKAAVEFLGSYVETDGSARSAVLGRLKDGRYEVRRAAVQALAPLAGSDDEVLFALSGCLNDRSGEVAIQANGALRQVVEQNPAVVEKFIARLDAAGAGELNGLVMFLSAFWGFREVRQALESHLTDGDPRVRTLMVQALAEEAKEDPAVRDRLTSALAADPDSDVRLAIIGALRELVYTDAAARQALVEHLGVEPDPALRRAIITALGSLPQSDQGTRRALLERLRFDKDPGVQIFAARALAPQAGYDFEVRNALKEMTQFGSTRVADAARKVLMGGLPAEPSAERVEREKGAGEAGAPAIQAAEPGGAEPRPLAEEERERLLAQLESDERIERVRAVRQLGAHVGSDLRVRDALFKSLQDPRRRVRSAAVRALSVLVGADDEVLALLVACLGDRSAEVIEEASKSLQTAAQQDEELLKRLVDWPEDVGQAALINHTALLGRLFKHPLARQKLLQRLQDADPLVRQSAVAALRVLAERDLEARRALLERMAGDENAHVRWHAVRVLSELAWGDDEVREAFKARAEVDPDPDVREAAQAALFEAERRGSPEEVEEEEGPGAALGQAQPIPLEIRTPEVVERAFDALPVVRQEVAREMHVTYFTQIGQDTAERARELQGRGLAVLDVHFHLSREEVDRRIRERLQNPAAAPAAREPEFSRYHVTMLLHRSGSPAPEPFEGDFCIDSFAAFRHAAAGGSDYGQALYRDLFQGEPAPEGRRIASARPPSDLIAGLQATLREVEQEQKHLNITIRVDEQAFELHNFQWEYLCAPGEVPLACRPNTPFARYLMRAPVSTSVLKTGVANPLRVLLALASPLELERGGARDSALRELKPLPAEQVADLAKLLNGLPGVEVAEEAVLERGKGQGVTLQALENALRRAEDAGRPIHVLHLACHGLADYNGLPAVVLETPDGQSAQVVPDHKLAALAAAHAPGGLKLVVLAACHTARVAGLGGVARALINQGVPAVVAMQGAVSYDALQVFSGSLFAGLLATGCIDQAVNRARYDLLLAGQKHAFDRTTRVGAHEWGLPVLFTGLQDGRLLEPASAADSAAFQQAASAPVQPRPLSPERARRMAEEEVRERLGVFSASLGIDFSPLLQAMQSAPIRVEMVEREEASVQPPGLFRGDDEREQRWRLLRAACGHRKNRLRRATLFLREQAREQIARLLSGNALASLSFAEFREQLWSPGEVNLEAGPEACEAPDKSRWEGFRRLPAVYRARQRALAEAAGAAPFVRGNLTWFESPRRALPDDPDPQVREAKHRRLLDDLRELIRAADAAFSAPRPELRDRAQQEFFQEFERITGGVLDPATASLALHARWPAQFAPYDPQVVQAVLDLWQLPAGSPYRAGYGGYCRLAHDLCADGELGFAGLADVNYFFQRLEANPGQWQRQVAPPEKLRVALEDELRLPVEALDSNLVIDPQVMPRAAAALETGKHIILIGPPGTGKTTLAEDLCRLAYDMNCSRGHILVTATADWTTFDTIGGYMPVKGGSLVFRPGIFLEAIRQEKWLVIDEINRADIDKSFGELFTVLSGQAVTLPYQVGGQPVRILPPGAVETGLESDYVIHPHWRIIGTMNVYDKASLFAMSYAFMRRFAFIDVDLPLPDDYQTLLRFFLRQQGIDLTGLPHIQARLEEIFHTEAAAGGGKTPANPLMHWRASGPAIAKDMVAYLARRAAGGEPLNEDHLAEALLLYIVPQFDGLEQDSITAIYRHLQDQLLRGHARSVLRRIEELFPYITDWPQQGN